jgi:hypothetical protein
MLPVNMKHVAFAMLMISMQSFGSVLSTPCGGSVSHSHASTDLTTAQKNAIIATENALFPDATRLGDPTTSYNCHAYAFAGSHGWINDPAIYIDSYEVAWGSGHYLTYTDCLTDGTAHSAKDLPESNYLARSKWGMGSLMEHSWDYVPTQYGMTEGIYAPTEGCTTNFDCM